MSGPTWKPTIAISGPPCTSPAPGSTWTVSKCCSKQVRCVSLHRVLAESWVGQSDGPGVKLALPLARRDLGLSF